MKKRCIDCKKKFEANSPFQKRCIRCGNIKIKNDIEKNNIKVNKAKNKNLRKKRKLEIAGIPLQAGAFAEFMTDKTYSIW